MNRAVAMLGLTLLAAATANAAEPVTFYAHIAPILHQHCTCCHRPGGSGPFALVGHRDVASHAERIREVIEKGTMPPWKAVGSHGEFVGDRRLSDDQKRVLELWIAAGCPPGENPGLRLPQRLTGNWELGEPDFIVQTKAINSRGPAGLLMADLEESRDTGDDLWLDAIEVRPRQANFKHVLLWLDLPMSSQVLEVDDSGKEIRRLLLPSWIRDRVLAPAPSALRPVERAAAVAARDRRLLGVWAGDCLAQSLPEGTAICIPAGARLIVEVHDNDASPPQLEVGLHVANSLPKRFAAVVSVEAAPARIAGVSDSSRQGSFQTPVDCELHVLAPHADDACREVRVSLTLPNGRSESLLWIDRWESRWETSYQFRRPLQVPARSRIDVQFVSAVQRNGSPLAGGPALVAAQLVPVQAGDYDELVRAMQRTQMQAARQPVQSSRLLR